MDADLKETLVMVADYTNEEKKKLITSLYSMIWTCIVAFGILVFINVLHLTRESINWDTTAMFCSAIGFIYSVWPGVTAVRKVRQEIPQQGDSSISDIVWSIVSVDNYCSSLWVWSYMWG